MAIIIDKFPRQSAEMTSASFAIRCCMPARSASILQGLANPRCLIVALNFDSFSSLKYHQKVSQLAQIIKQHETLQGRWRTNHSFKTKRATSWMTKPSSPCRRLFSSLWVGFDTGPLLRCSSRARQNGELARLVLGVCRHQVSGLDGVTAQPSITTQRWARRCWPLTHQGLHGGLSTDCTRPSALFVHCWWITVSRWGEGLLAAASRWRHGSSIPTASSHTNRTVAVNPGQIFARGGGTCDYRPANIPSQVHNVPGNLQLRSRCQCSTLQPPWELFFSGCRLLRWLPGRQLSLSWICLATGRRLL